MDQDPIEKLQLSLDAIKESIESFGAELNRHISLKENYQDFKKLVDNGSIVFEGAKDMEFLLDVNTGVVITLLDLAVISKNLILSASKWEKAYFVKQTYLCIYESLKTFNSFQKGLRLFFENIDNHKVVFREILKELRTFKQNYGYDTELANVRNKAAGHIDCDFVLYHTIITSLDQGKAIHMQAQFISVLSKLSIILGKVVTEKKLEMNDKLKKTESEISEQVQNIVALLAKQNNFR